MRTYNQMPERLGMADLAELIQERPGLSVSFYLPTNERRGHEVPQEPLLLRRLVEDVGRQLAAKGWRAGEITTFLAPIAELAVPDQSFWPHQQRGLAIFRAQDFFAIYQLPEPTPPKTRIGTHFWLRPLISAIGADGHFYLLALSQNKVQLYRGLGDVLAPMTVPQLPTALGETLRYDQFERTLQFHSTSSSGGASTGRRAAVFHGQGDAGDERIKHQQLDRFLQEVAEAVHRRLAGQRAPLFLAGVDYIQSIYRRHNHYPHLMMANVPGNVDHLTPVELRTATWPLCKEYQAELTKDALKRFVELTPLTRTADNIETVVHAAQMQQVDSLFVSPLVDDADAHLPATEHWGTVDATTGYITRHTAPEPADEELVDYAVLQVLRHGGTVYPIPAEQMPGEIMAAILRY
ncbi:MAG: hypothetical protein KDE31_08200 [Caldilineaceae bacterium]|nr:hypothetical protein [Caldilineaceae bacterium]